MLWKRRTERRSGAALALRDRCACYAELLREGGRARLVNADKIPLPDGLVSHGRLANGAALGRFCARNWRSAGASSLLPWESRRPTASFGCFPCRRPIWKRRALP